MDHFSWSEDVEDSGFPEDFDEESLDDTSNDDDKASSYKSGSSRLSKVERHSGGGSSTDLSVTTRSNGSKSYTWFSHNENVPSAESENHLLDLLSDSGFPMTQVNGQRKLGPPPGWSKPPPDPSCEVFVGKIPRNLYEHEIYPIFKEVGDIYEIRLMMDFSGTNRGYCFVMFTKIEYAKRAIKELNNYAIRPGRKIGVVASINNCRLWIGQLPTDIDPEVVIKKFYEMTDDVSKVAVYKYPNGHVRCALVSYKTHRAAAMARRRLLPERGSLFVNVEISADWAPPNMSFSNVVEINGKRDEAGKLQISQTTITNYAKRRGSQRRSGDDFLDKSIKNYLQENCASLNVNQRKSLESTMRLQKSTGRVTAIPRRKGYRVNQTKVLDPAPRSRGCIKEYTSANRSRSLLVSSKENYTVGSDGLWYPKNRDINGNFTFAKKSQISFKTSNDFCNEDALDSAKSSNSSITEAKHEETISRGRIKILTRKGDHDGPLGFNLFEHYALQTAKKLDNTWDEKSYDPLSGSAVWGESISNVFSNLEARSDGDLRKPQENQSKLPNEKASNFTEFEKWNSTESFVPKIDIPEKQKDTFKSFRNQRRNCRSCSESGIPRPHKIMPNFQVLSPLTNCNGNYNPNLSQENVDYYAQNQQNLANIYTSNSVANFCQECAESANQCQVYYSGGISAVHYQPQTPYVPQHDWRIFNGTFVKPSIDLEQFPTSKNIPPQSLFTTSSFADYNRFLPQIYCGNGQMLSRPRPILNRLTSIVGDSN